MIVPALTAVDPAMIVKATAKRRLQKIFMTDLPSSEM
jgi:hypothetical protein